MRWLAIAAIALAAPRAAAAPAKPPMLVALVPGAGDDARKAIAIGPGGEVYEPDGKGAWRHQLASTIADPVTAVGRAGDAVIALGDGAVYRLADNGWSAIRLVQHGKAILGAGPRALAAVGRQVFGLEQLTAGEPTKLVLAPGPVVALTAGAKTAIVETDSAIFRLDTSGTKPGKLVALPIVPRHARLISDRWAILDRGALELPTNKLTRWPAGVLLGVAAAGPDDTLVAIGATHAGLELLTVRGQTVTRDPIPGTTGATAIGVVVDHAGRATVAFADGKLALRDHATWITAEVSDPPPAAHPGAGPALSQ